MGTRGFVTFVIDGREKTAYNHADSAPEGLGLDVLRWLRDGAVNYPDTVVERARALRLAVRRPGGFVNRRLLSAVAGALAAFLGLVRPLEVPRLVLVPWTPVVPGRGQVPHVRCLPGDWTPMTGGGAP